MKIVDNFKKIVSDFTRASNSTSNIGNQFLRQGNRKTMSQDWSSVLMSDQDIYTGYPYGIINKRANKLAYLAISNLHTDTSKDISTKDAEKGIVHPYLQLIDKSPSFSNFKFWHDISVFLDLEGVYYVMAVRNFENNNDSTRYGDIQDFEMLNPYNIRRVVNARTLELGGYVEHRNGLSREIPKEMIIEIKDLNPFDENDPYSMTDALTNAQFTLRQANDYTRHSLKNNLSAPGAISTDVVLEDQQFSNFVNRITNQEKGMPLFGNGAGSIKWDPMQIEMDKAALDKITDINRSELFAVSGVGKTNLAIEESGTTRETAKVQKDLLTEDHTIPKLQLIIDALNQDYKNKYPKEYEKTGYTIAIQSPLGVDKDSELKDIKVRSDTVALYNSMVDDGYNPEIAAQFINGEIQLKDIGMPQKPVSQKDDKTIIEEDKDDSRPSESGEKNALLIKNSQELIISTIESKLKSLEDKINNKIVINVEKEKKITVDNAEKKADNLQPIEKTNQQNNPVVTTDTVIIRNAVDDDSQSVIETQQGSLQNSIVDIETRLTGSVLTNFNKIENQLSDENEILSQEERDRLVSELTLVLAGFYMLIIPLYARTIANRRLKEFGSSTDFEVNNEVKKYIDQISSQVSESHINTIFTDLYRSITNTYNDIIESQIEKIKDTGRKVTDDDLVLARKTALEGGSRQQIVNSIKDEYKDITANRAKAIARTETNRAFTQAQYQADLQFIKQNGYDGQAYKKWITRSSNPCPTCLDLASQPPIPFTKNFADLGDKIITTYEENGKTKVKTQMVDFEPLSAGNAHVNCGCTYQLIIENNVLNNFEKDENSGNPYRDSSSGRFTTGPSGVINSSPQHITTMSQEEAEGRILTALEENALNGRGYNPNRDPDGKFGTGPSTSSLTQQKALYDYQDYAYQDINTYLRVSAKLKNKKELDIFDKRDYEKITKDKRRLADVKEHIKAIDGAFNSDEAKVGGSGHRIDSGVSTDLFMSTDIQPFIEKLRKDGNLPETHNEWYDTKAEYGKQLEEKITKTLKGKKYTYDSYISTDSEKSAAFDRFASGNSRIESTGMETYVNISSSKVKTIRVNDFTGMDSYMGQDNPENEILFDRGNTFEIYNVQIVPSSADGYAGTRGEGFQLHLYMKDVESNNSFDEKIDNKVEKGKFIQHFESDNGVIETVENRGYNPNRDSDGRFTFGPSGGGAYRDDDMTIGQFEEFAKGYSGSATEAELKHIIDYQNSEARPINANLKETKGKTDKQSLAIGKGDPSNTTEYYIETYGGQRQELVKTMDSKMIHSLKENHILYRGMSVDADLKVGDSIKSYGFTSSSFSKDIAATFTFNGIRYSSDTTKEYVLRVIAPEGTKGLIPHALTGARTIEQEFIFPRGTDFKVTKIIGPGHTESEGKYTPSYNYTIIEVTL